MIKIYNSKALTNNNLYKQILTGTWYSKILTCSEKYWCVSHIIILQTDIVQSDCSITGPQTPINGLGPYDIQYVEFKMVLCNHCKMMDAGILSDIT